MADTRRKPRIWRYSVVCVSIVMLLSLGYLSLIIFENTFVFWLWVTTLFAILIGFNYYFFLLYKHYYKGATKKDSYPPEIGGFVTIGLSAAFIGMFLSSLVSVDFYNIQTISTLIIIAVALIVINTYYIVLHKNYYKE